MSFRGRVEATGVETDLVGFWGTRRLRILTIPLLNAEGAPPLELGEGVLRDERGEEVGRVPARLAGTRLEAGKRGLLMVAWPVPLPGKPVLVEIRERNGVRTIQVRGDLR